MAVEIPIPPSGDLNHDCRIEAGHSWKEDDGWREAVAELGIVGDDGKYSCPHPTSKINFKTPARASPTRR